MTSLGVLGDSKDGSLSIVDPVWSKEAAECGDKDATTIIGNGQRLIVDFAGVLEKTKVVGQEIDTASGHGDAAFESIGRFGIRAELVADGGKQAVLRLNGLFANVVKQEAACAVRIFGLTGREGAVADESG